MILVNEIGAHETAMEAGTVSAEVIGEWMRGLVLLLAPFAPFLAAELWEQIGGQGAVFRTPWPVANEELARESEMEIPVQVNGKLVVVVKVAAESAEETLKAAAMAEEKVQGRLAGKTIVKTILVKGKLVNFVVR